uniref:sodium-dependent proline transporter-like n=1 Tax=Myxine glutinosa TaxID=7769 RepID=UPI0035901FAF
MIVEPEHKTLAHPILATEEEERQLGNAMSEGDYYNDDDYDEQEEDLPVLSDLGFLLLPWTGVLKSNPCQVNRPGRLSGAFLIPYMLMLLLGGIASLYMEMAVGQYSRRGPYHMLCQFCPLFKGLGLVMTVTCFIGNAHYIIIVVWSMFYLFKSFQSPFPWQDRALLGYNESFHANASTSAGQVYFNQKMLRISQGISHPGGICWDLLGLLLLAWIAVYFCIFRGIKLAGKVVYFTALFPYCLLLGLLINNCLLPGAWEGISYFIVPRWSKLMNVEVWIQAAGQIFSSLGVGEGVITSFSSYKDFNSVLLRDVLVIVLVNSMTSILSGFVIFSGLGYLSHVYNTPVENIAVDGPGLVFMVYPEVLSTMPLASVWAVSFFFMLFCLGIDSAVNCAVTIIGQREKSLKTIIG